jgi:hypothetical protein
VAYVRQGVCRLEKKRRMCTEGCMSPREEEAYVRRGACRLEKKKRMCVEGHVSPRGEGVCVSSEE